MDGVGEMKGRVIRLLGVIPWEGGEASNEPNVESDNQEKNRQRKSKRTKTKTKTQHKKTIFEKNISEIHKTYIVWKKNLYLGCLRLHKGLGSFILFLV